MKPIYTTGDKKQEKFLRAATKRFHFDEWKKEDIEALIRGMRETMRTANGIGLSANQIGLPWKMFVAEVPSEKGLKFYAIFNPELKKEGSARTAFDEGCLSIPGVYGEVTRPAKVTLAGQDRRGKSLTIKAWGLLARVFQHEVDHLNGTLFVDKVKKEKNV